MSSDTKPNKPMPSVAEINAYLEQSAARTRLRLPLAKGAAAVVPPKASAALAPPAAATPAPSRAGLTRALPLQGKQAPPPEKEPRQGQGTGDSWRPFGNDDDS